MNNKSLIKNSFFNVLYNGINILFPLITTAYVSRILMPEGVGAVSASQNFVRYFYYAAAMGIPTYGVKAIAQVRNDYAQKSKVFSELLVINSISTLLCTALYALIILPAPFVEGQLMLYLVSGLLLLFNLINVDWFYVGEEQYQYIAYRSIAVKVIIFALTLMLVKDKTDIVKYAGLVVFGSGANYVFNIIHLRKFTRFSFCGLELKRHLKPLFLLVSAAVAAELYVLLGTSMLKLYYGDEIVGYYSSSTRLIVAVRALIIAICAVFFPRMNILYKDGNMVVFKRLLGNGLTILCSVSLAAATGLILLSDKIVLLLFGPDYTASVLSTQFLAVSVVTIVLSSFLGNQVLVTLGRERNVFYSTLIGATINVLLNLYLIRFKHYGVAFASLVTEASVTVYQLLVIKKTGVLSIAFSKMIKVIVPSVVMGVVMFFVRKLSLPLIPLVILSCVSGVLVWIVAILFMRLEEYNIIIAKCIHIIKTKKYGNK